MTRSGTARAASRRVAAAPRAGYGRDDPERALGADEQIDQIHARGGMVAGGALRHRRIGVRRNRHDQLARGSADLEEAVGMGQRPAALEIQDLAVWQHHRHGGDPVPRGPVLERVRARRVGRYRASDEGAGIGGGGRIPEPARFERILQRLQGHARTDPGGIGADLEAVQARRRQQEFAHRRRAARQRRLRADRQNRRPPAEQGGDLPFGGGKRDAGRPATRKVRRVFQVARQMIRVRIDHRLAELSARRPRGDSVM